MARDPDSAQLPSPRVRIRLSRVAKLALLAVMVWWLVRQPWAAQFIRHLELKLLIAALAVQPLVFASLAAQAARHAVLARVPPAPFWIAFRAVLLAQGLNTFVPGRLSEILKATYLRDHAGILLSAGFGAILIERLVDLMVLGALGAVAIASLLAPGLAWLPAITAAAAIGVLVALPFLEEQTVGLVERLPWPRAVEFVRHFHGHVVSRLRSRSFYLALAYSLAAWAASVANIALFLRIASDRELGFAGSLMVFVATTFGAAIPALPGGFGTYEAGAIFALSPLGFPIAEALVLAVVLHVAQLVLPLFASALILAVDRVGVSSLIRQLREESRARD